MYGPRVKKKSKDRYLSYCADIDLPCKKKNSIGPKKEAYSRIEPQRSWMRLTTANKLLISTVGKKIEESREK